MWRWIQPEEDPESPQASFLGLEIIRFKNRPVGSIQVLAAETFNSAAAGDRHYLKKRVLQGRLYSHGGPSAIADDRNGRTRLSPSDAADLIRNSGLWSPGMPIRLYGCETAQGENSFASQLSNLMGDNTVVIGADQPVFPNLNGGLLGTYEPRSWPMSRYPNRDRPGNWRAFAGGQPVSGGGLLPINR